MTKRPPRRRVVDPAVADILGSDRRIKQVTQTPTPDPAPAPPAQTSPAPKRAPDKARRAKKSKVDNRDKPMSYRIGESLIGRINAAADDHNVEKSSLVKFLLNHALDSLEKGELALPLKQKPQKLEI